MKLTNYIIGAVAVIALILGVVGVGSNNQSSLEKKVDTLGVLVQNIADNMSSFGSSGTRFPNGISADTTSPSAGEVRGSIFTSTGTLGVTGTSTFSGNIVGPVHISITQAATTTAANPPASGYMLNSGNTKLCLAPEIYLTTANGRFASNWAVGTTTASGHASLTATTTATLIASHGVVTSTVGIIGNVVLNKGSYWQVSTTSQPWVWKNGEYLVVSSDYSGATSSEGFTSGGGFTTPKGTLTAWCWDAY